MPAIAVDQLMNSWLGERNRGKPPPTWGGVVLCFRAVTRKRCTMGWRGRGDFPRVAPVGTAVMTKMAGHKKM